MGADVPLLGALNEPVLRPRAHQAGCPTAVCTPPPDQPGTYKYRCNPSVCVCRYMHRPAPWWCTPPPSSATPRQAWVLPFTGAPALSNALRSRAKDVSAAPTVRAPAVRAPASPRPHGLGPGCTGRQSRRRAAAHAPCALIPACAVPPCRPPHRRIARRAASPACLSRIWALTTPIKRRRLPLPTRRCRGRCPPPRGALTCAAPSPDALPRLRRPTPSRGEWRGCP